MAKIDLGKVTPDITNNLETTETGTALDAAQGPVIQSLIDEGLKYEASLTVKTKDTFLGKPVYTRVVHVGALPAAKTTNYNHYCNNTGTIERVWYDIGNTYVYREGSCYPLPNVSTSNGIPNIWLGSVNVATFSITTLSDFSTYGAYICFRFILA